MVNIYIVTNTKISSTSQIGFHSQPRWYCYGCWLCIMAPRNTWEGDQHVTG